MNTGATRPVLEPTKQAFRKTWPGGYSENFEVYEKVTGGKEADIVARCLKPFELPHGVALEIGCGHGFWVTGYLLAGFEKVIGLDVIPEEWVKVKNDRFKYVEVPDRNYDCFSIPDASVDFVWSFGCFCHLPLPAIAQYLTAIRRVLKPGGKASLYFSNTARRPQNATVKTSRYDPETEIIWCDNDWPRTRDMMRASGFVNVVDLMPAHKDTMAYGERP